MINKTLLDEEDRVILSKLGPEGGTVFWFDADLVELTLVNRHYGMESGNELLCATEKLITSFPGVSFCVRARSSRFVFDVISEEGIDAEEVKTLWDAHVKGFVSEQEAKYPLCNIRICCGICEDKRGAQSSEAIDNAALARKESRKSMGYATVIFSEEWLDLRRLKHELELEVRDAFKNDRFTYYLQPITSLETGEIVSAEALARVVRESGEIVYPDEFLPLMEEDGTVIELDFLIAEKVMRDLKKRLDEGRSVACTSINLSRLHTKDPDTAKKLHALCEKYGVPPELVKFEITETIPVNDYTNSKRLIDELRAYGHQVWIDDYGSGYAGITVLQDLDFDVLKMDKRFLSDDEVLKKKNAVLIPNTIDIAHRMNIEVVCEGVEREEQRLSLLNWGCRMAQGFLYLHPVPIDEFYKYYEENRKTHSPEITA